LNRKEKMQQMGSSAVFGKVRKVAKKGNIWPEGNKLGSRTVKHREGERHTNLNQGGKKNKGQINFSYLFLKGRRGGGGGKNAL